MKAKETIPLHVARDFGETFNISIKFLRQNYAPFLGSLLLIAGPFILVDNLLEGYYQSLINYKKELVRAGRLYNMNTYTWHYFVSKLLAMISNLAILSTVHSYMLVYKEKGNGSFTAYDVRKKLFENIGNITKSFSIYLVLLIIFGVAIGALFIAFTKSNYIVGAILFFTLGIGAIILLPNLYWRFSTSFIVIIRDQDGPLDAFEKTKEVRTGQFWWTWLLVICSSIATFLIAVLLYLPMVVYSLIVEFIPVFNGSEQEIEFSILHVILFTIFGFLASFVSAYNHIVFGFHFYSLTEKQEGIGLLERIDDIGKKETDNHEASF